MKNKYYRIGTILMILTAMFIIVPFVMSEIKKEKYDKVVAEYEKTYENAGYAKDYEELWNRIDQYNQSLGSEVRLNDDSDLDYQMILPGMICTVEIPKISVRLPVYHGTEEKVLANGAGHLKGTSFPSGKEGTHAVISAHSAVATDKLFTDLPKLSIGDRFLIHFLDQTFEYEIDQILTVLPNDVTRFEREEGEAFVTLITCVPYGINSHRLLVRGKKIGKEN